MPTAQTNDARKIQRKQLFQTKMLRRIAKVAGNEKALKAELQQMIEKGIRLSGTNNSYLNKLISDGIFRKGAPINCLNEMFTDFVNCAYVGITCAAEINANKEKILTCNIFKNRIIEVDNTEIQAKAIVLLNEMIKTGLDASLKNKGIYKVYRKFYGYDPLKDNAVYVYEADPSIAKAQQKSLEEFFNLYKQKNEINVTPEGSSDLLVVTCPGLSIQKSEDVFLEVKNRLLALVATSQHQQYKKTVEDMLAELSDGDGRVWPSFISIIKNATKLIKRSERLDDRAAYLTALDKYNKSVETLKTSPGIAKNKKDSIKFVCASLALLVVCVVSAVICATVTCGVGGLFLILAGLTGLGFLFAGGSTMFGVFQRKTGGSLHSLGCRFKHTTLFADQVSKVKTSAIDVPPKSVAILT